MKIFQIILISLFYASIKCAVIGIDFGSEFFKVSMIAPGKSFQIVENTASLRKTHTAISFSGNNRQYESNAITKRLKFPKNSFQFIQKFLGSTDPKVKEISKKYFEQYNFIQDGERETYKFQLDNVRINEDDEENATLKIEEVTAMILKTAQALSEKQGKQGVKDCVITVPSDWTLEQRQSLQYSAEIAGINVLGMIKENSAAALFYGIERSDDNQTINVLFYNIGSYNVQASLVQYSAVNYSVSTKQKVVEQVKVLADYGISDNGGLAFDLVLANYFADKFDEQPVRKGQDSIRKNRRAMVKLMKECNTLKEKLSANKEAQMSVEGLLDGLDFQGKISRQEFEELASDLLQSSMIPVQEVVKKSGLSIDDINQVEILGGGVRMPKIQQLLAEILPGVDIGAHMNGDESMAQGAAFFAANLSKSFRVRQVDFYDGFDFSVNLTLQNLDESIKEGDENYYYKQVELFPYRKSIGSSKIISLTTLQDLKADLTIIKDDGTYKLLYSYNLTDINSITNESEYNETQKPKLNLQFDIDSIEGPILSEAFFTLNYTEALEYFEYEKQNKTESNETKEQNKTNEGENTQKTQNTQNDGETKNDGENQQQEIKNKTKKSKPQKKKVKEELVKVKKIRYIEKTKNKAVKILEQKYLLHPMKPSTIKASQDMLKKFDSFEENVKMSAEIKNKLEALVYQIRDYFQMEIFVNASTVDERELIEQKRLEEKDWIDSDDIDRANYTVLKDRYNELQQYLSPIYIRLEEARQRPEALNKTIDVLAQYWHKVEQLNVTMPWITSEQRLQTLEKINTTYYTIRDKFYEQYEQPLNTDPLFKIEELKPMIEEVKQAYLDLKSIKKPRKSEEKKEKNTLNDENIQVDGEISQFQKEKLQEMLKKSEEEEQKLQKDGENKQTQNDEQHKAPDANQDL